VRGDDVLAAYERHAADDSVYGFRVRNGKARPRTRDEYLSAMEPAGREVVRDPYDQHDNDDEEDR
jgi:hypothetical protein